MFDRNVLSAPSANSGARLTAVLAGVSAAIFVLDAASPAGVAGGVLYVLVIPLSVGYRSRRRTALVGVICSLLTVAGYVVSDGGGSWWAALSNRGLSLLAIWVCTLLSLQYALERERFRLLVEAVPSGLIAVDQGGAIVLANAQIEQLFGYRHEELLGERIEVLIPERLRPGHQAQRSGFLQQPKRLMMGKGRDLFGRRKDGTEFEVEVGLSPVSALRRQYVLATVVDVTERKRAQWLLAKHAAELEAVNSELRRSNADLDAFAHLASHDLQEPLRTLSSYIALLREDLGPGINSDAYTDLHFIDETTKRMNTLVQDLLAFSRAGRRALESQPVALEQCIEEALLSLRVRIQETGAEIRRCPLPVVEGDMTLLTQLYQNLLGNALKFVAEGERPVIELGVEAAGDDYLLSVKDNGIGIEPSYAEQIFEPFKRLHARNVYPGSGVGLALCRRAVERHGGRIWVESEAGRGSRFVFSLPKKSRTELSPHAESSISGSLVSRG